MSTPAVVSQPDPALEEKKFFLEKAKLFRDHVQGVLALATGSLVLSVTFLHDKGNTVADIADLRFSWIFFMLAILAGIAYNYVLAIYAIRQRDFFRNLLVVFSSCLHALFLVAIFFLARFGLDNIGH
jgi:hypothetical protein